MPILAHSIKRKRNISTINRWSNNIKINHKTFGLFVEHIHWVSWHIACSLDAMSTCQKFTTTWVPHHNCLVHVNVFAWSWLQHTGHNTIILITLITVYVCFALSEFASVYRLKGISWLSERQTYIFIEHYLWTFFSLLSL